MGPFDAGALFWLFLTGRMPCLFHEWTGLYCPGCGGTRALKALLRGHPILSFWYHPLILYCAFMALLFAVSYGIWWKTKDARFRLHLSNIWIYAGIGIILVNFVFKNYMLVVKGGDLLRLLPAV